VGGNCLAVGFPTALAVRQPDLDVGGPVDFNPPEYHQLCQGFPSAVTVLMESVA
ncbi:hypothetical protein NDU88_000879, partial [Pleurodeles waltl]